MPHPPRIIVGDAVRIDREPRPETLDQDVLVAVIGHPTRVDLRVPDIPGADPVDEDPVHRIVVQDFFDDRQLVAAHLGMGEAELAAVVASVASLPAMLRMRHGVPAWPSPRVVVLVDAEPGMDLQPNLMPIPHRLRERIDGPVVVAVLHLAQDRLVPVRPDLSDFFRLRGEVAVSVRRAHRIHQPAGVERSARIEAPPVDRRPPPRLAHVQHVPHSGEPIIQPLHVVLQHPVRMGEGCAEDQLAAGRWLTGAGIVAAADKAGQHETDRTKGEQSPVHGKRLRSTAGFPAGLCIQRSPRGRRLTIFRIAG